MDGEPRSNYPGWSRVIVCLTEDEVRLVTAKVKEASKGEWIKWSDREAAVSPSPGKQKLRALTDMRKAVWSVEELRKNSFGGRGEVFEYALDDADRMLTDYLRVHKPPERITMTGLAWT